MKKSIIFLAIILSFSTVWSQNVGIGTTYPGTKLDVNGALTLREGIATVSGTSGTIPNGYSQVRLTGSPTGAFTLTAPVAPLNPGEILLIYNNTSGGYAGIFGGTCIPNGTAIEFIYSNSRWVQTAPASSGSGDYIQNQNAMIQPASTYRISGGAYVGGADTVGTILNVIGNATIGGTLYLTPSIAGLVYFAGANGAVVQDSSLFWDSVYNRLGIGTISPASALSVGSSNQFRVDSIGNIVRIHNVATNWPSTQGAASSVLTNDGSGNFSWQTLSSTGGAVTYVSRTADTTTSGISYVSIGHGLIITPGAGDYVVFFNAGGETDGGETVYFSIFSNGTQLAETERCWAFHSSDKNNSKIYSTQAYISGLGAGQTIEVKWKTLYGSTVTIHARSLIVQKVQ